MYFKPWLQVILNDVRYHKYNHHHHHHWQIPCENVALATGRCQPVLSRAFLKPEWRQIIRDARSFSTLQVLVVKSSPFDLSSATTGRMEILAIKTLRRPSSSNVIE